MGSKMSENLGKIKITSEMTLYISIFLFSVFGNSHGTAINFYPIFFIVAVKGWYILQKPNYFRIIYVEFRLVTNLFFVAENKQFLVFSILDKITALSQISIAIITTTKKSNKKRYLTISILPI